MEYQVAAVNLPSDPFLRGYLECAEWCGIYDDRTCEHSDSRGTGEDCECPTQRESLEDRDSPRWSDKALASAQEDCEDFQAANTADLEGLDEAQAGHDFYLTRNHHGAGFWDGDYPGPIGQRLTAASHPYGSADVWFNAEDGTLNFD